MSLNWDNHKIADYEALLSTMREQTIQQTIALSTIAVGLGSITAGNAGEFYARLDYIQRREGALMWAEGEPYFITADDVVRRVGLISNVSDKSRTAWLKSQVGSDLDAAARRVKVPA